MCVRHYLDVIRSNLIYDISTYVFLFLLCSAIDLLYGAAGMSSKLSLRLCVFFVRQLF